MKHPMQSIEKDGYGVVRFKKNEIVCYLLDRGFVDMNDLAILPFSKEDREQFAQLIGYSVSGISDLSYVSEELVIKADAETERLFGKKKGD